MKERALAVTSPQNPTYKFSPDDKLPGSWTACVMWKDHKQRARPFANRTQN
jgi:hypothetical protein